MSVERRSFELLMGTETSFLTVFGDGVMERYGATLQNWSSS
jgi:hypothetical protein